MCLCVFSFLSGGDDESPSSDLLNAIYICCLSFEIHLMRKHLWKKDFQVNADTIWEQVKLCEGQF